MTQRLAALAMFVKTPGLSPIKTRLAAGIGGDQAEEFYGLSLAAVGATAAAAAESGNICPYWAVAEEHGMEDPRWKEFPRVYQGSGNLGERLARVFAHLQLRHEIVVAIGGDSPQITASIVREAVEYLRQSQPCQSYVLGRCHDGGFYLFGTNDRLPAETWHGVPFGDQDVANRLAANLYRHGGIVELPVLGDVDQVADLPIVRDELSRIRNPSPQQLAVLEWTLQQISTPRADLVPTHDPGDSNTHAHGR